MSVSTAPVAWEANVRVPRAVRAVLAALRFSAPARVPLHDLNSGEWKEALAFTDPAGLTLILGVLCRDDLPPAVRERIDRNLANNIERIGRSRAELLAIIEQLKARGLEHALIKGFSHEMDFVPDPYLRVGYDIDLLGPRESVLPARDTLASMQYESLSEASRVPTDHLPPMVRKTGWQWAGDYFDPGIPPWVDLHFRFWDAETEGFDAPGAEEFWERRVEQDGVPVLNLADRLGYAALHLLRHLFRGNLRPCHVYEIAYFLDSHSGDDSFWNSWRELHAEGLRRLEAIAFRLASAWFGCRLSPVAAEAVGSLNAGIQLWFERYAAAPLEAQFHPNKHEIWLQFELVKTRSGRARVFVRRMFPATLPLAAANAAVPKDQLTWQIRLRGAIRYARFFGDRALYHIRSAPPVAAHGLMWSLRASPLPPPFWRFLACSLLYSLGMYQYVLLYNLYLLDLGFREGVLGLVNGSFTAGSFAGVLPAAWLANRWGLKRAVFVAIVGGAAAFALRVVVQGEPLLAATAFAGGAMFALWGVVSIPVVAAVTSDNARPAAYSFIAGSGIGLGMAAAMLGGRLPGWFAHAGLGSTAAQSKQWVMLAGSVTTALALLPLRRLRLESQSAPAARRYPRGPFIRRFLMAVGVWSLATGALNPLFNAFFARAFQMPVERIGMVFSSAQGAQVIAIFCAPMLLRRLGLGRGVAAMQLATAAALGLLASAQTPLLAAGLYISYMGFQYMSEPGIFSSLMNRVTEAERSSASAMNLLVLFGGQSLAAIAGGAVAARFGYAPMLLGAALLAVGAGILFWNLPREKPVG